MIKHTVFIMFETKNDLNTSQIQLFCEQKSCLLIWNGEKMRSKVIFGLPKWLPAANLSTKIKVAYWSEMARNAIESGFQSSKMAASSHFVKTKKKVWYWSEMARNAIESDFRSSKMAAGSHFVNKNQSCVLIWNGEKCDRKWFSVFQNGCRQQIC